MCEQCKKLESDALTMALRLMGEGEDTMGAECREVMARWRTKCRVHLCVAAGIDPGMPECWAGWKGRGNMDEKIWNLFADNKKLPKGTRIKTTCGGIYTGGIHELSDSVLESANSVPNILSEYVPFWVLGWRDLHNDLLPPDTNKGGPQ